MKKDFNIGFGCYLPGRSLEDATDIIKEAMECGYRYFDTASFYETERALGAAIKLVDIPREELCIASKLWIDERGYKNTKDAFYRSLDRLGLDYLDYYLIHWPKNDIEDEEWKTVNDETFRAMEELKKEGLIKHIGASNFLKHHMKSAIELGHKPELNQLELHPGYMQELSVKYSKENDILVQAWSPLGRGAVLENDFLVALSSKYGKTVPQICLMYLVQNGIMPLVKASKRDRMLENINVFDVKLEEEDMMVISCMPPVGWSGEHPDFVIPKLKSNFEQ